MDPSVTNTIAVNNNTIVIIVSTIITVVLAFVGYNHFKSKNTIKKTINKKGTIKQGNNKNMISDVDNTEGKIEQK